MIHEEIRAKLKESAPHSTVECDFRGEGPALIHYRSVGDLENTDRPIAVLIHGLSHWLFTYDYIFDHLAKKDTSWYGSSEASEPCVLSFDLFGRGFSSKPDGNMDESYFCDQLEALLKALNVKQDTKLFLSGHSLGGAIALAFAARNPERVLAVSALAPAGIMPATLGLKFLRLPFFGKAVFKVLGKKLIFDGQTNDFAPNAVDKDKKIAYCIENVKRAIDENPFVIQSVYQCLAHFPVDSMGDTIAKVTCPTQLVWGPYDVFFDEKVMIEQFKEILPSVTTLRLENAGHAVHHEEPEIVHNATVEFFKANSNSSSN